MRARYRNYDRDDRYEIPTIPIVCVILIVVGILGLAASTGCVGTPEERADSADKVKAAAKATQEVGDVIGGPVGLALSTVGGIAVAALGAYAETQRRKARSEEAQAKALIEGAEKLPPSAKKKLRNAARRAGVSPEIERKVAGIDHGD